MIKASNNSVSFENTEIAFSPKSDSELLKTYLLFKAMNNNWLVEKGMSLTKFALKIKLPGVKSVLKYSLFKQFCGGESINDCQKTIELLSKFGVGTILDYSVEGEKTDSGFDKTEQETVQTILQASKSKDIPFGVFKVTGLAKFSVLEKISAQLQQKNILLTHEDQESWEKTCKRVENICQTAHDHQIKILIDGEETWIQPAIDLLAYQMMEKFNKKTPIIYNTYQMYVADKLHQLKEDLQIATEKGYFLGAKLVRGAYMEKERERAKRFAYPDPIQPNKEACDRDFDASVNFCLENIEKIGFMAASHNEKSNLELINLMKNKGIDSKHPHIFFAQLFGMSDHISYNLAKNTYNVSKYLPYGPVRVVMPYLFRRASENTSIKGQSSREYLLVRKEMIRRKKMKNA